MILFSYVSQVPLLYISVFTTNYLHNLLTETSVTMSSSEQLAKAKLPLRKIPGDYGGQLIGPIRDRLDYFYLQGEDAFFASRIQTHSSTVFRANMPPGPFISSDPRVIVLLDAASFPVLFDLSKVERKNVLTGTYVPSKALTGGYRVLAYLDPSESNHTLLKQLVFNLVSSRHHRFAPDFQTSFSSLFYNLETQIGQTGKSDFSALNDVAVFDFLSRAFLGVVPSDTELGKEAPKHMSKWLFLQVCPIKSFGWPKFIEEILLRTFPLPPFLAKSDYKKLYNFFYAHGGSFLDDGENKGLTREETCHNLVFLVVFNAYGGMKLFFPLLLKWIGSAGEELHKRLANEIRSAVGSERSAGGDVTIKELEKMPLVKSVVYEALRIQPPVPYQYGRAKKDLVIESHEAAFEVKKGEMLFGFQPFATKDPKIFERAEEFVGDRFIGEGEKLVKYVMWSNGFGTDDPTVENKQCPGKDVVILISRLFVVDIFRRYDTFKIAVEKSATGPAVMVTSVTKVSI